MKLYLFIFLVISLLLVFAVPTYLTYRKTGINPITFGKEDNAHNYIGRIFKILMALLFAVFAVNLFSPDIIGNFWFQLLIWKIILSFTLGWYCSIFPCFGFLLHNCRWGKAGALVLMKITRPNSLPKASFQFPGTQFSLG